MVYQNGMTVWYIILYSEHDIWRIYTVEISDPATGEPISEPKFFDTLEDAENVACAMENPEWEIYQRVG